MNYYDVKGFQNYENPTYKFALRSFVNLLLDLQLSEPNESECNS